MKVLSGVERVESSFFATPLMRNWYDFASLLPIALNIEGVIGWSLQESSNSDQSALGIPPVQGVDSVGLTCSRSPIFGLTGVKEVPPLVAVVAAPEPPETELAAAAGVEDIATEKNH